MMEDEQARLSGKYLEFIANEEEYEVRCRECKALLHQQPHNAPFDKDAQRRAFDHLLKHHRVTETMVRDACQRDVDDAIERGEIDPPYEGQN